jgi:hypothetical protein
MKKLMIALTLTIASFSAKAETSAICSIYANYAERAMTERQKNEDLSILMTAIDMTYKSLLKSGEISANNAELLAKLNQVLLLDAYKHPLYNTSENKLKAVIEFKNDFFARCLTA